MPWPSKERPAIKQIFQVGATLPIGAKSAIYKPEFQNFQDLALFVADGGQKGVQRSVLAPGTVAPIHPGASLSALVPLLMKKLGKEADFPAPTVADAPHAKSTATMNGHGNITTQGVVDGKMPGLLTATAVAAAEGAGAS